jgi:YceI-like domain
MPTFDASNSECFVYVYREGILSAVGHDLKLRVTEFTLVGEQEPLSIHGEFRANSLRVIGALRNGMVNEHEPSAQDKQEIENSIARDVLETQKYPMISFHSTAVEKAGDHQYRVSGRLDLHGVIRMLNCTVAQKSGWAETTVSVHQPDFNITPYRAFLGTLRVKPGVRVEMRVPFTFL